jgi:hypothetical protein
MLGVSEPDEMRTTKHLPQETIDEAADALRYGRPLAEIATKLGVREDYLAMLLPQIRRAATLPA